MKRKINPFSNKLNLQFFAEPEPTPEPQPVPEPQPEPTPEPQPTAEEQIQQLMVENAKLKKAMDKAATDAADWKKKYNATLTDAQKAAQEKAEKEAEREEQLSRLLKENTVNKYVKNFLKLGYSEERAEEAAIAQYDGDTEALFRIQSDVQAELVKQKEAEWLKSRPQVVTGVGDEKTAVTKDQFNRMGYIQRVEFKQKYPETYKSYTKK